MTKHKMRHEDYERIQKNTLGVDMEGLSSSERARLQLERYQASGEGNTTLDSSAQLPSLNIASIPEEYEYAWKDCMSDAGDAIDPRKYGSLLKLEYTLVPPKRHPESTLAGGDQAFISYGNLVLMERPKAVAELDRRRSYLRMSQERRSLESITKSKYTGGNPDIVPESSITKDNFMTKLFSGDLSEYVA